MPRTGETGCGRGAELEASPQAAEQVLVDDPAVEAVDHHRGVHRLEDAALDEPHLAAAALLGGRADDLDATLRQLVAKRGQRGAGADAGGGDDVVAARVTDAGQRVVLAEDRDRRSLTRLDGAAKRRLDAGDAALHLEALLVEKLGEPCGGLDLLVPELGIVVDLRSEER